MINSKNADLFAAWEFLCSSQTTVKVFELKCSSCSDSSYTWSVAAKTEYMKMGIFCTFIQTVWETFQLLGTAVLKMWVAYRDSNDFCLVNLPEKKA